MLKRILLLHTLFFCLFNLSGQEWSNMKLEMEIGVLDLSESEIFGLFLHIEPKLKSSENTVIGLRIGATINSLSYENYDSTQFIINEESGNGIFSIVPTFDYYWNENKLRPNLGVGVGAYSLVSFLDVSPAAITNPSREVFEVYVSYRIGFLLRGGLALGKSRLGLEYNFAPKAELEIPNGTKIGIVDLSYLGLSIGFTIVDWKNRV